jgi:uncharacterized protein YukE
VLAACTGPRPIEFTVTFDDAQGLEPGDEVVYRGVVIGTVREVTVRDARVHALVRVDPEHLAAVYKEADFAIESAGTTGALTGSRELVMTDSTGERTPVAEGDVIHGRGGRIERALGRLQQAWQGASEAAREFGSEVERLVKDVRTAPETEEFLSALSEFGSEARETGREEYEKLRRERLPELKREAEQLRDKLLSEGRKQEAEEFWEGFKEWLRDVAGDEPPSAEATPTPGRR